MANVANKTTSTLRKLGAHLRWFLEFNGVKAEDCQILIGVKSHEDRRAVMEGINREFDPKTMQTIGPDVVELNGIKVYVRLPDPA